MQTLRTLAARLVAAALLVGCSASSSQASVADAGPEASIDVAAPRPVSSRIRLLRDVATAHVPVELGDGSSGARVEICAERACTRVTTTFARWVERHARAGPPAGVVFWRLRGTSGASDGVDHERDLGADRAGRVGPGVAHVGAMSDGNGDGYGDVVAGDSDAFTKTQHVYVYLGGPSGRSTAPSSVLCAPAPQLRATRRRSRAQATSMATGFRSFWSVAERGQGLRVCGRPVGVGRAARHRARPDRR